MSEQKLEVVYRMLIGNGNRESAISLGNTFMEKIGGEVLPEDEEDLYREPKDGFSVSYFPDTENIYLDYYKTPEETFYGDIDLKLRQTEMDEFGEVVLQKFGPDLYSMVQSLDLRVLGYYSGGCAGLSEVE